MSPYPFYVTNIIKAYLKWPCTLTEKNIVQVIVNEKGDTLIQMSLDDAKIILTSLIEKDITDSILAQYIVKDSINTNIILIQSSKIYFLNEKINNLESIIENCKTILYNKDSEIAIMNEIMKKQQKEIKKQKRLKIIGFISAAVLPIVTLFTIMGLK